MDNFPNFSGPPKINFSTWSERPKVEVAVMNDRDYIFGKQNSVNSTVPRDSKTPVKVESSKTTSSVFKKTEIFASKPLSTTTNTTTTLISTEKQHMPPKVLGVEYKKDVVSN